MFQCGITFIGITAEELRPSKLRGYGELSEDAVVRCNKTCEDLTRLIDQVATHLSPGHRSRAAYNRQNRSSRRVLRPIKLMYPEVAGCGGPGWVMEFARRSNRPQWG